MTRAELEARLVALPRRERLDEALRALRLYANALSSQTGVTERVFSYYRQHGGTPKYDDAVAIADALGLSPDVLWTSTTDPPPPSARRWSLRWRRFARDHGMGVRTLVTEAVEAYIDATEAAEHDYRPAAQAPARETVLVFASVEPEQRCVRWCSRRLLRHSTT